MLRYVRAIKVLSACFSENVTARMLRGSSTDFGAPPKILTQTVKVILRRLSVAQAFILDFFPVL